MQDRRGIVDTKEWVIKVLVWALFAVLVDVLLSKLSMMHPAAKGQYSVWQDVVFRAILSVLVSAFITLVFLMLLKWENLEHMLQRSFHDTSTVMLDLRDRRLVPLIARVAGIHGNLLTSDLGCEHFRTALGYLLGRPGDYGLNAEQPVWEHVPFDKAIWLLESAARQAQESFYAIYIFRPEYEHVFYLHDAYHRAVLGNRRLRPKRCIRFVVVEDSMRQQPAYRRFVKYNRRHGVTVVPLTAEQCPDAQAERRDFGVFDYEHPDRCLIVRVDFYPLDSYKRQAGGDHQFPPRFMVRKVQLMRPGADEGLYALLAHYLDLRGDRREPIARPRAPTPGGPAAPEPQAPASPGGQALNAVLLNVRPPAVPHAEEAVPTPDTGKGPAGRAELGSDESSKSTPPAEGTGPNESRGKPA